MTGMIDKAHMMDAEKVLEQARTDGSTGLSRSEAQRRLEVFGKNTIETGKNVSALRILFNNINNIIVYLLIAASVVAFVTDDAVEGAAVAVAILIAVVSGFLSEYKAQRSVESLKGLIVTKVKAVRDSNIISIDSKDLVFGDIVYIEEGDSISADARLIMCRNFATAESSLTGESEAIEKDYGYVSPEGTPLGDRTNMIYAGTAAVRGNAYAVVTATGMNTEIGRISGMLSEEKDSSTPLEKQLHKLGKTLIIFSAAVALSVTAVGLIAGEEVGAMIKIGIILAIAAVPEALPAVSTITLALGMKAMARNNALVKSLPAVETLGSTTVICTDKTGTLTEDQMTVKKVFIPEYGCLEIEGSGYVPKGRFIKDGEAIFPTEHTDLSRMLIAGVLSSNASLAEKDGVFSIVGTPTEGSFIVLAEKADIRKKDIENSGYRRIGEIPFNSSDKYMATAYETEEGAKTIYIKGAHDAILNMIGQHDMNEFAGSAETFAGEGMRVLAVGEAVNYEGDGSETSMREHIGKGIRMIGLAGIYDPPREDVEYSVKECRKAGIRVIMITGDHPKTALNIAGRIGMDDAGTVMTGREMDKMTDEEMADRILMTSVFARVSPENKLQIVRALRADKEVTAMTGDGVNDAPALKGADIGIAMGIRGTEVAKDASDMILTDDRFSTIVKAVEQGRIIFANIEKFVFFLFSCNVVEILAVFLAILLSLPLPVTALQILWLNLVVDILPAMSLAWEPGEKDIMRKKPRDPEKAIVTMGFMIRILTNGALIGLGSLAVFYYGTIMDYDIDTARTMAFSTMAFGQLFHIFNIRKRRAFGMDRTLLKNRFMIFAMVTSVLLQLIAVYMPFFNRVMDTVPLDPYKWTLVFLGASIPTLLIQIIRRMGSPAGRRKSTADTEG